MRIRSHTDPLSHAYAHAMRARTRAHAARIVALLGLLLTLSAATPGVADAASGWYHDWTYGATPRPLGDNNHVDGMATDGAGNVYVADNYNHRAQKFTSSLTSVLAFGTAAPGQGGLRNPQGVGVSPVDGSVYVTDSINRKIEKFDAAGQSVLSFGSSGSGNGQFNAPGAITVKSDGEVWVSDTGNHRIQRFSSAGAYLGQFGTSGTATGQFNGPRGGCFATDGTFYVADSGNNRIQRFSATGVFMNAYGSVGVGNGQFQTPFQVGCDPGGAQFVVADTDNHRVQRFNSAFAYAGQFGSNGTATGQFQFVHGVAIDSTGRIWASDFDGSRVQVFSNTGAYIGQAGSDNRNPDHFKNVFGAAANDAGSRVYVSDTNNHRVQYYDGSGNWLGAWGTSGTGTGQFNLPYGIDVDGSGNVFVVDQANHRVQKFTANGVHLLTIGSAGTGNGQFQYPWAVAVSPVDGSIYVTDESNSRVQRFSAAGAYMSQVGSAGSGNGQFNKPHGISVDAAGDVYVADNGNNRIQRFTAALAYVSQFGTAGAADGQFTGPSGVSVLPDNTIVVVENSNPRIQQFSNAGAFLRKAGSAGIGTGQLGWPRMVNADASGAIYIADASNSRAVRWRLSVAGPPNTLFVHDTNAQSATCGGLFCVNPTDISAAQPHFSWINQYGATVTGQRTRVHTDNLAGVVGLWHFDGDRSDASGLGGTMSDWNVPGFDRGAPGFGSALYLDGVEGMGTGADPRYVLSTYTLDTWFRAPRPVTGYPFLVTRGTSNLNRNYGIFISGPTERLAFTYSSGGVAQYPVDADASKALDGLWHHAAVTVDGTNVRIYLDGELQGTGALAGPPDNPPLGPSITDDGSPLWVDDLRISNVVRSSEEIAGYYRTRLPHATLLWDSSPSDTPVANGSCTAGSRCADVIHGTGGTSPLGALRGGRFTVQQKQHDGTSWSDWSLGDWFEQTIGRPALGYVGDGTAATGSGNNANVLALNPRMSWTNNKGRTNGTINRQRVQVVTTPLDDVQALWHLDNTPGELVDSSGNGNTLTAVGGPGLAAGNSNFGQARSFNGSSQFYTAATTVGAGTTLTVDAWFRTSGCAGALPIQTIASKAQSSLGAVLLRTDCDGSLHVKTSSDANTQSTYSYMPSGTNVHDGQWHHAAAVVNGTSNTTQVFLDGVPGTLRSVPGTIDDATPEPFRIGFSNPNRWFNGDIDEVRVSTVARSAAEIKGYYETRRPHFATMWDNDAADTGANAIASCADLARCADVTYAGAPLRYAGARYYSRARFKSAAQSYWTAWSDYDWFEAATPPAPSAFRTHDTNANPGSINPSAIVSTTPHFSFVANSLQDANAQRTQVVTTTLDDVVGLWHLDGSTTNSVPNGASLTPNAGANAPTTATGRYAQGLAFDGADGATAPLGTPFATNEFTAETWFSSTTMGTGSYPNLLNYEDAAGANRVFVVFYDTSASSLCGSTNVSGTLRNICAVAPPSWRDGSWHHVAYTRTAAGLLTLLVDGQVVASASYPGTLTQPAGTLGIGHAPLASYANYGFSGSLDDVRISSKARSTAELLGAYRTGRPQNTVMWDSNPSDTGAALATCATGTRCADQTYGTGGGQLPLIRNGARYYVRAKVMNQASSWSAWGSDWFEVSETLTVGVDSATRTIGPALAGTDVTGTTVVTVTTNNATGYQLSATDQDDAWGVRKDASNSVPDWTGPGAAPTAWAAGTSGGFGISVLGATGGAPTRLAKWGTGTNTSATDFTNNLWAGLDLTSSTLLHERLTERTAADTVTVAYRGNVAASQQGGTYTGSITYTAVANP